VDTYHVLDALGDRTRREILERLALRPQTVGQLAEQLPISRPAVSQHLKVLLEAGVVLVAPMGTRRIYRVDPDGIAAMRAYFDRFWNQALAAFKAAAEQPKEEEQDGTGRGSGRS
jgi:DNA-binding transcriptional ArsR family regulator